MTILFLARRFYPQIGGVEKHVMEIRKRFIKKGHTVTVVAEELENTDSSARLSTPDAALDGIHIKRIPVGNNDWWKKFRIWLGIWKNRQLIKEADVVHCHDVFFWYLPFRFLFPWKPVYTTFHGYESYPISQKAVFIRKLSEKLSWGTICIGDFIKKWYKAKPSYVSYGAVEIKNTQAKTNNKIKKDSAVFIGRLDEQTGIVTYVKAAEMLRKQFPAFDLLVVGDGKYRKEIEKQVRVLGFQQNPEKYFQHYHFAFVSRYLSILEAFAARRLVFAVYDNPLKKDYLTMTPFSKWIVTAEDEKELSEKVVYFLQHPNEEKERVEAAYRWAQDQSWDKMVDLYQQLWQ